MDHRAGHYRGPCRLRLQEPADARLENHLAVHHHQFFIQIKLHRPAEHVGFQRRPFSFTSSSVSHADVDVEHILQNNRAFIELLGDEMGGAAMHAHAAFVGLFVGAAPGK